MDTMDNKTIFDEEEALEKEKVVSITRKPYVEWDVDGKTYKLKLTTSVIRKLEQGFEKSLLTAVLEDGIPPIGTVITLLQAAMQKYHHGIKSYDVELLLDDFIDAGESQISLLQKVIYPLMHDAGFFTTAQMTLLTKELAEMDTNL